MKANSSAVVNLKISIEMDEIFYDEIPVLAKSDNVVDINGNPIDAYYKRPWGKRVYFLNLNGITISLHDFLDKWKEKVKFLSGNFMPSITKSTDPADSFYILEHEIIFYRVDCVIERIQNLNEFFKEIFDVELDLK